MGICLDTEQQNGSQELRESGRSAWADGRGAAGAGAVGAPGAGGTVGAGERSVGTPPDGKFHMQNNSHVKFEAPKVPVIFVLGGPGSGKVTHCDNLMQEKKGVVHINMTDLLQQYAIGNEMQDFGTLSSRTVTEVLMLEMKMAPAAKTYLVSGYPRSMRDVAEYSDKIQVVNGVILVSWRQKVLERQIEYGARLGHVVLNLARMELNNFYKNVMPVADYFDQSNMLVAVNGERNPGEVYNDFRSAVLRILGSQEDPSAATKGVTGAGPAGIPGEIAAVEPAPPYPAPPPPLATPNILPRVDSMQQVIQADVITVRAADMEPGYQTPVKGAGPPPALWVIGGPGSNKAALCQRVASQIKGWIHLSVGRSLRQLAESSDLRAGSDAAVARQSISNGEMVPHGVVMRLVTERLEQAQRALGIIIDGFPRDIEQAKAFEQLFHQHPQVVLLDCSKLQLGRGRLDDSVAAFRRRLELFRELSLPMLKSLDADQRLTIVDGDTDTIPVQEDFSRVMLQHMSSSTAATGGAGDVGQPSTAPRVQNPLGPAPSLTTSARQGQPFPGISTISQQVHGVVSPAGAVVANGVRHAANGAIKNGAGLVNGYANGIATGLGGLGGNLQGAANAVSGAANAVTGAANGGLTKVANGFGGMTAVNGMPGLGSTRVAPLKTNGANARNNAYHGIEQMDTHI